MATDAGQHPKSDVTKRECGCEMLLLSHYSPELVPLDYYLLQKMKYELRRKWFESNTNVMVTADNFLGVHAFALLS